MRHVLAAVGVFMFSMGCNAHMHPYADYLQESVGRENHEAIASKMGVPYRTVSLDKGGDVWIYEYCPNGSSQCQYVDLIFDKSGTLAEWFEN
jgi:hypothetical protein